MQYKIEYESNPNHDDIQRLNAGIAENTQQKRNFTPIKPFAFFIRDEHHQLVGGCAGCFLYGSLYVDQLWVAEALRGQGYGTRLMLEAEKLAKKSDCQFMSVNTFDWEALDFYKKLGFYVEFERRGFYKNSVFYFLRKDC